MIEIPHSNAEIAHLVMAWHGIERTEGSITLAQGVDSALHFIQVGGTDAGDEIGVSISVEVTGSNASFIVNGRGGSIGIRQEGEASIRVSGQDPRVEIEHADDRILSAVSVEICQGGASHDIARIVGIRGMQGAIRLAIEDCDPAGDWEGEVCVGVLIEIADRRQTRIAGNGGRLEGRKQEVALPKQYVDTVRSLQSQIENSVVVKVLHIQHVGKHHACTDRNGHG